jgi:hypothetical protein
MISFLVWVVTQMLILTWVLLMGRMSILVMLWGDPASLMAWALSLAISGVSVVVVMGGFNELLRVDVTEALRVRLGQKRNLAVPALG